MFQEASEGYGCNDLRNISTRVRGSVPCSAASTYIKNVHNKGPDEESGVKNSNEYIKKSEYMYIVGHLHKDWQVLCS